VNRHYDLEVVAKWEGTHGFGSITLRPPSVDGMEWENRPWWIDKTATGSPLTVSVTPEEMAEVEVGTLFRVSMEQMTTVGDELARREAS